MLFQFTGPIPDINDKRTMTSKVMFAKNSTSMRWEQVIVICLVALLGSHASAHNFDNEVPYNKPYPSPDGTSIVQLLSGQNPMQLGVDTNMLVNALSISNIRTGRSSIVYIEGPPYVLKWTKDSKTIVTVEHVAGGNTAKVYNYDGTVWKPTEIGPPTRLITHSQVTALKIGSHDITITFLVEYEHPEQHAEADLHEYTVVVNGRSGMITKTINQREIKHN